jgi:hypothetical protein
MRAFRTELGKKSQYSKVSAEAGRSTKATNAAIVRYDTSHILAADLP